MALIVRIEPAGEELSVTRPEKLAQASVLLRDELQSVPDGGTVVLTAHEPTNNAATIRYVLEHLLYGFADAYDGGYDAKSVAGVCNVLVAYECDPEQFQVLWDRMTQKSSLDQGGQRRCWRTKIPPRETLTASQLVVSALVLGKVEELAKELGVVVWALDSELETTVPELQNLQAMRLEEQKHIYDELRHQLFRLYADRNDQRTIRLADKILQDVRDQNLGELTNTWEENCSAHPELRKYNPYKLIRRFEGAIKPPDPHPSVPSSKHPTDPCRPAGSRSFPIDLGELRQVVGQGINSFVKRKTLSDNSLAIIDGIFNAVEARVKTRQRERAMRLIEQRQGTVAEWMRELQHPGSFRRPSPKGKGHQRVNSDLSVSQLRSLPRRPTNGYGSSDNGEGSSRMTGEEHSNERLPPSSLNYGQWAEPQDVTFKGKGKEPSQSAAEPSSVPTRRKRAENTTSSPISQGRQGMLSVAHQAGSLNEQIHRNGVEGITGVINGLDKLQMESRMAKDSWRYGDDSWRLGGP